VNIRRYIIFASGLILFVFLSYFIWFYFALGSKLSSDPSDWGQLGSYVGGILGPLLSFVSIVLLIKSLTLQYEANANLKAEIINNYKSEKLKSFEVLFFNLISSQRSLFDSFRIDVQSTDGVFDYLAGPKAVMEIENKIETIRIIGGQDQVITEYLNDIDDSDQIFGLSRAFYIIVMIITDKLSDAEGFSSKDRSTHFKALINLTYFPQLRIIMMCVQFLDYESTKYLRSSSEFKIIIENLGLSYKLY
jgi:hypothetical protein